MKKIPLLLLLTTILILVGGVVLTPHPAQAAQQVFNCNPAGDRVMFDHVAVVGNTSVANTTQSNPIQGITTDCGPATSVVFENLNNIYTCSDDQPATGIRGAYSQSNDTLKLWFVGTQPGTCYYVPRDLELPSIPIKYGGTTPTDEPTTTGYYCDRTTNPTQPTCKPTTNPSITATEYQCSLNCQARAYNVAVTPYKEPWRPSWNVGETIDLKAEITPTSNTLPAVEQANWIWDFGDGSDKVYSYYNYGNVGVARHAYSQPGTYIVTAQAYNNGGVKELNYPGFAGTREIIISGPNCVKPQGSRTNFNRIVDDLENYQLVDIAADSPKEWVSDNLAKVIAKMVDSQCRLSLLRRTGIDYYRESALAIKNIKRYTDSNLPYLFALYKIRGEGGHQMIAININEVEVDKVYKIRVVDPNGPEVKVITCKNRREYIDKLGEKARGVYCDYYDNEGNTWAGLPLLDNIDTDIMNSLISAKNQYCQSNSQSKFCLERQNLSRWLRLNHTFIHNPGISAVDLAANGSCVGWSDFNLRMAYLANFVGECEGDVVDESTSWNWSSFTAGIGSWPWVELLTSLMRR